MSITQEPSGIVRVSAGNATEFVARLLVAHGVSAEDAKIVAGCLVSADLRGVDTHGILRLPGYLDRVRKGLIDPAPAIDVERITPVVAKVDGKNGFGFVVAHRAMAEAVEMARAFGVGVSGARNSTHFGMAANYALQAVESGFAAMIFTNSAASMPPWGGRVPIFGTSPLAVGVPGGKNGPFVFDMASSVASRGRIRKAIRRGEPIPEGYALDAGGKPTTDPKKAIEGLILPVGGPKGSGIAMTMDIFSGVLTGAAFGDGVGDQFKNFDRPQNVGHFFLAMNPSLFVSADEFRRRMEILIDKVRRCPPAEGFEEVMVAGDIEFRHEAERRRLGIPYNEIDLAPLQEEAKKANLPPLPAKE